MAPSLPSVRVDVISDSVCPWCFVGKRRLEQAMSKFSGKANFDVVWHPYQLNPDAPEQGQDKMEMYNKKFGAERIRQMVPAMQNTFREVGLEYKTGGLTGNTLNSHRLISWAASHGAAAQNALVEELMLDYFTRERYINDRQVLLGAAVRAGLPADEAQQVLEDPSNQRTKVVQEIAEARRGNVTGVPHFTINDRISVSGAQNPETFEQIFEKMIAAQ